MVLYGWSWSWELLRTLVSARQTFKEGAVGCLEG